MFFARSYVLAIVLCVITMLCWGSWANMQKAISKKWAFQLFYWDYGLGVLIVSFLLATTLGNHGDMGRSFFSDLWQADTKPVLLAFVGGIVFNLANILLVAAIEMTGMAVAFPVAIGLALVLGVVLNYVASPVGHAFLLFTGVICVGLAIVLDAKAYKMLRGQLKKSAFKKGLAIALTSGVLMGTFYFLVAASMVADFVHPEMGKLTPYSAGFIFALGLFLSNFITNTWMMKKPLVGRAVHFSDYISGGFLTHFYGVIGGVIWGLGTGLNFIAAGTAGPAISYGLGQGATLIAALWGVLIWREFKNASKAANRPLAAMFIFYLLGLFLIVLAKA